MVTVYILFILVWGFKLLTSLEHRISIHIYLTALLFLALSECVLIYLEYDSFNKTGKRGLTRTMVNIFVSSMRSTLANLVFLLISLGFGTVTNNLGRYLQSIGIVAFLFFVSAAINKTFHYLSQTKFKVENSSASSTNSLTDERLGLLC
jgi:hypothetical protein